MFSRFARTAVPTATRGQVRHLNIQEFQAKRLLKAEGCKVEYGLPATTLDEVRAAVGKMKTDKVVVKAQILAGGRGKGTFVDGYQGGVHVTRSADEAFAIAGKMLGNTLVTKQTGPKGQKVSTVFITESISDIKREVYVALILDRKTCSPMFIGSAEGGMGIEELAAHSPEKIKTMAVNIHEGIERDACVKYAKELGFLDSTTSEAAAEQLMGIYKLAKSKDCTMVEINPLVETESGEVYCLDAKLSFDDNAKFRHEEEWKLEDKSQIDPKELAAEECGLNYIALDGNVGCLVNGAGLAMATMDMISMFGQRPANFLDVGGSASKDQIVSAFRIVTLDPNVKCILVNIFGGIMKCDVIAAGIVGAAEVMGASLKVPIVVRLEGTNEELGRDIIAKSGMTIHNAADLEEAARIASELSA